MMRTIAEKPERAVFVSYNGLLWHGNTYKILQQLKNEYWLRSGGSGVV